jgi:hypothetical protein
MAVTWGKRWITFGVRRAMLHKFIIEILDGILSGHPQWIVDLIMDDAS